MSFVAVVDVFLDAESLEEQYSSHAEQYFLLQSVLPVAAVEGVCYRSVELGVELVVGVEQIEGHASNVDSPYVCVHVVVHVRHVDDERLSVFVELALDREGVEVLCVVVGDLLSVHAERLLEVSVSVQESYSAHVYVAVGSLLHIVAGKHSEAAGIDFENLVYAELHTEVCY